MYPPGYHHKGLVATHALGHIAGTSQPNSAQKTKSGLNRDAMGITLVKGKFFSRLISPVAVLKWYGELVAYKC